ncbi:unnamed protein product, partial [Brassica rapa subsp. trilocularis]
VPFVIHRTLREGDPTFIEELLNYSQRRHIFKILKLKLRRRYKSSWIEHTRSFSKSGINAIMF